LAKGRETCHKQDYGQELFHKKEGFDVAKLITTPGQLKGKQQYVAPLA